MFSLRFLLCSIIVSYTMQKPHQQQLIEAGSFVFWVYALISLFLSCFAGVCSGLTVGYMAINKQQMQMWVSSGTQDQKAIAKPILQVLENHHLLLSTLLLSNALSLEALPIFLDKIVPGYMAIVISTVAVVVFGQVIPQAYCTGHHKVMIGYYMSGFMKALQTLLYIFVKPIVYVLDNWLGHHDDKIVLTPQNLKAILYLHNNREYGYRPQEIQILQNTMDLRMQYVGTSHIKIQNVYMVDQNSVVDQQFVNSLEKVNYSKIPVYSTLKTNIVGFIKVKNLLSFDISKKTKLKDGNVITQILKINQKATLLQAIDLFKSNRTNFAVVIDHQTSICKGIITLKQIFQKLVLKQFKDNDVRLNVKFDRPGYMAPVMQGKEQD